MPYNPIEAAEALQSIDQQTLNQYMRNPPPGIPAYQVAAEVARRADMAKRFAALQAKERTDQQTGTVIEDVMKALNPGSVNPTPANPSQLASRPIPSNITGANAPMSPPAMRPPAMQPPVNAGIASGMPTQPALSPQVMQAAGGTMGNTVYAQRGRVPAGGVYARGSDALKKALEMARKEGRLYSERDRSFAGDLTNPYPEQDLKRRAMLALLTSPAVAEKNRAYGGMGASAFASNGTQGRTVYAEDGLVPSPAPHLLNAGLDFPVEVGGPPPSAADLIPPPPSAADAAAVAAEAERLRQERMAAEKRALAQQRIEQKEPAVPAPPTTSTIIRPPYSGHRAHMGVRREEHEAAAAEAAANAARTPDIYDFQPGLLQRAFNTGGINQFRTMMERFWPEVTWQQHDGQPVFPDSLELTKDERDRRKLLTEAFADGGRGLGLDIDYETDAIREAREAAFIAANDGSPHVVEEDISVTPLRPFGVAPETAVPDLNAALLAAARRRAAARRSEDGGPSVASSEAAVNGGTPSPDIATVIARQAQIDAFRGGDTTSGRVQEGQLGEGFEPLAEVDITGMREDLIDQLTEESNEHFTDLRAQIDKLKEHDPRADIKDVQRRRMDRIKQIKFDTNTQRFLAASAAFLGAPTFYEGFQKTMEELGALGKEEQTQVLALQDKIDESDLTARAAYADYQVKMTDTENAFLAARRADATGNRKLAEEHIQTAVASRAAANSLMAEAAKNANARLSLWIQQESIYYQKPTEAQTAAREYIDNVFVNGTEAERVAFGFAPNATDPGQLNLAVAGPKIAAHLKNVMPTSASGSLAQTNRADRLQARATDALIAVSKRGEELYGNITSAKNTIPLDDLQTFVTALGNVDKRFAGMQLARQGKSKFLSPGTIAEQSSVYKRAVELWAAKERIGQTSSINERDAILGAYPELDDLDAWLREQAANEGGGVGSETFEGDRYLLNGADNPDDDTLFPAGP
mgnify:CR=1 FL=1